MTTSLRYIPVIIAIFTMMGSYMYKILFADFEVTHLLKDIVLFFILYIVVWIIAFNAEKVLIKHWKTL